MKTKQGVHLIVPLLHQNHFTWGSNVSKLVQNSDVHIEYNSICWWLSALPSADSHAVEDSHRRRSGLESLFCYDKAIPEEIIEKPTGLSLAEKNIGDKMRCSDCQAKGAVLCATCSGSGLYLDSILESQGIMVKVRCLGCGGSGNIMCSDCGGRGHIGV